MKNKYQEYLSNAQTAFISQNYEYALELLQKAILLEPGTPEAYLLAGNCSLILNRITEAEVYFKKGAGLDRKNGDFYFGLGSCSLQRRDLSEALENFAEAQKRRLSDGTRKKIYYTAGVINQELGKDDDALINYEKAQKIKGSDDDLSNILLNKIKIFVKRRDLENAEKNAIQLKILNASEFKSYQLLFQIYLAQKKIDAANEVLNEANTYVKISEDSDDHTQLLYDKVLSYCFLAESNSERAQEYYRKALNLIEKLIHKRSLTNTRRCDIAVTRAEICYKTADYDKAAQYAEKIIALAGRMEEDMTLYADKAKVILMKVHDHNEEYDQTRKYAAELKKSMNISYRHLAYYTEAYAARKLAANNRKMVSESDSLYDLAIAYYKNCTVVQPGDYMAHLYRARSYVDIHKYDKAEDIAKLLPDDAREQLQEYIKKERGVT